MTSLALSRALFTGLLATIVSLGATAGPGAHGPNGEHLDSPTATTAPVGSRPRFEAHSEQFELVATLDGGKLSMLIDRFATNEPVLNAQVEIESGGLKAKASFHEDIGDYAVTDEALLKLLGKPGEHAVVVTLIRGDESDLLDGSLKVTAEQAHADDPGHPRPGTSRKLWLGIGAAAALLIAIAAWQRRAGATSWKGGQA